MQTNTTKTDIRPFTRQFFRGNHWRVALAIVHTFLSAGASIMISWVLQQIVDMTTGSDVGFTFSQMILLTLLTLGLDMIGYACAYASKPGLRSKGIGQYKEYVFSRLCRKGIGTFNAENSALYLSALSNDTASIETNYFENYFLILDNAVLFCGALGLMFHYSPLLTLISIGLSVLPLLAALATGGLVAKAESRVSQQNEAFMTTLKDSLTGFSLVKAFQAEAQIIRIFAQKVREVSEAVCLRQKMRILVQMLSSCAGNIVQFGVFLIGAGLALSGAGLSAGTVLVFVQLLNFVIYPVMSIPQALSEIRAARALIEKTAAALGENQQKEGQLHKESLASGIRLEGLSFAYEPEKPVLRGLDFFFEAGKSYAIVGASGSGKSTLLNLLLAASTRYGGKIYYDDTELRELESRSLYGLVSAVQQDVFIFNASIRDNITMFAPFPTEAVDRAMALSGLSELVAQRGEDYLCGENGSGLSGGEKQRIAIARGLLKKSRVLLADEATAALDAQTAFQVSNAILDLEGLTRIVVSHALDANVLSRFDCILALKNGQIIESGSFRTLMDQKGYFYSLYTVSQ